jgi:hypothetical protein
MIFTTSYAIREAETGPRQQSANRSMHKLTGRKLKENEGFTHNVGSRCADYCAKKEAKQSREVSLCGVKESKNLRL